MTAAGRSPLVKRRLMSVVIVMFGLAALTACSHARKAAAAAPRSSLAPFAQSFVSPPARPGGQPQPPRCTPTQLELRAEQPMQGTSDATIHLINRSNQECTVQGYPTASLLDDNGSQLGTSQPAGPNGTVVVLQAGHTADFELTVRGASQAHCASGPVPSALVVIPPGLNLAIRTRYLAEYGLYSGVCSLTVTAVHPGGFLSPVAMVH
jgi:hypothetical protein